MSGAAGARGSRLTPGVVNLIALAVGAVGLAFVLRELGWEGMSRAVVGTGAWFAVTGAIDVLQLCCDAFAIHGFLRVRTNVPYATVFAAEASGLAINRLTPGNSLGEPMKIALLARRVATTDAVAAIVMFNLATMFVAVGSIAVGVPLTALLIGLPEDLEIAVWVASAALVAFSVAMVVVVRRGALATVVDAVRRVRLIGEARAVKWRAAVAEVDDLVRRSGGWGRGLAGVAGARATSIAGTVVVLHACGIALTPAIVIAAVSVGSVVTWMSNVVPLGLGLADGANYVLYGMIGATHAAGLLFTMVNRLRTCVIAGFGLLVLAAAQLVRRAEQ